MAGPGGREVGRLSVRVLPDTSNFAVSLQRYLDRIEARSRLKIRTEADMDQFSMDVRTQLHAMERRYQLNIRTRTERFTEPVRAQLRELQREARIHVRMDVDRSRLGTASREAQSLGRAAGGAASGVGFLGKAVGILAGALTTLPSVAGLTSSIAQMGPAAAVAAPAVLSLATAGGALVVGMQGMGTALSDTKASLDGLTPSAAKFVKAVRGMKDEWASLRKSVQEKLFKGLADQLERAGKVALPVLKKGLGGAAEAVNKMGAGILTTARNLSKSGALGQAMAGANKGLTNMADVPGQILEAFVKLSAGAAPAFDRLTKAIARGMSSLTDKLTAGLKSGGLDSSIDHAIDLVKQFGSFLKDLGTLAGNIFGPAADVGADFFGILQDIVKTLAEATGGASFQTTLMEVFRTLHAVGKAVSDVLGSALDAVGPLLSTFTSTVGPALRGLLDQVVPVLQTVVKAAGKALGPLVTVLAQALAKLAPVIGKIVTALGDTLVPIFDALGPVLATVADTLITALMPTLEKLPAIIQPFLDNVVTLAPLLATLATTLITALGPALARMGELFSKLMVAVAPLVAAITALLAKALSALMPILVPLLGFLGKVLHFLVGLWSAQIEKIVIPIIKALAALLRGDFSEAWKYVKEMIHNVNAFLQKAMAKIASLIKDAVVAMLSHFAVLKQKAWDYVVRMGRNLRDAAVTAMLKLSGKVQDGINKAVGYVKALPSKAKSALGDLGSLLKGSGRALIGGFIDGIKAMVQKAKDAASGVVDAVSRFFPHSPAKEGAFSGHGWTLYSGRALSEGFAEGISDYRSLAARATSRLATVAQSSLANPLATVNAGDINAVGLQPGDTIALTLDGQTTLQAVIQRGAEGAIHQTLASPLRRGRK